MWLLVVLAVAAGPALARESPPAPPAAPPAPTSPSVTSPPHAEAPTQELPVPGGPQGDAALFEAAGRILQSNCAMPACHAGPKAAQGLRLEAAHVYRTAVNVRARTDGRYLRVDPGAPDRSLLVLKLLAPGEGHYRGPRMPMGMTPLSATDVDVIRRWIASFPSQTWGAARPETAPPRLPDFKDRYLANLPTPETLGARTLEFRFSHRFKGSVTEAGSKELFGLDTGAWISLEMAYGVSNGVDVGLRRTNLQEDYEGYAKWAIVRQGEGGAPISLAVRGSVSDARAETVAHEWRYGAQVILSRRFGDAVSLLLVPTHVTRTNSLDPDDDRGTTAVGAGIEWRVTRTMALTGEYIAQTDGVTAPYQGGSIGLAIGTARHVFTILLTNTQGVHTDLYAPGGDLDVGAGDYRLGFNISRTWSVAR
jgi:hypothetical protein